MAAFQYKDLSKDVVVDLVKLAAASYGDGPAPPSGWRALTGGDIGYKAPIFAFPTPSFDGTTFSEGDGAAAQVYRDGNALTVSFRGTDFGGPPVAITADLLDYPSMLSGTYYKAFDSLLKAVADYAAREGIETINVVGHSLGAGAVNNLRDVSATEYGGAFDNANYVTIAAPTVAKNPDILNIGFLNDLAFKVGDRLESVGGLGGLVADAEKIKFLTNLLLGGVPQALDQLLPEYASTTDLLVYYDDFYATAGLVIPTITPHDTPNYIHVAERLTDSVFYDAMSRDSLIFASFTNLQVTYKTPFEATAEVRAGQGAFYIGRASADNMLGGPFGDFMDGEGGNDILDGAGGDDEFHGGRGNDRISGGPGSDLARYSGSVSQYDFNVALADGTRTVTIKHSRGSGADGTDILDGVEYAVFGDGISVDLSVPNPGPSDMVATPVPETPKPPPNAPPSAVADAATTGLAAPVSINVLANDTDADGTLTSGSVTVTSAPLVGTATARNDGTILYVPEDDLSAGGPEGYTAAFAYTVADNDGATSAPATVTVTVRNAPPAAVADTGKTDTATPVAIPVLANDTDDGGALVASSVVVTAAPAIGTAAVQGDGSVLYTPDDDIFVGGPEGYGATFAYTVADSRGAASAPATVTVAVERVFDQVGTTGPDRLRGDGFGDDKINGGDGNDEIDGGFGTDLVYGAAGDDTLQGGPGRDRVEGGVGNDLLDGGFGDDVLNGAEGNDELRGGFGDDLLDGGIGSDVVRGEYGSDRLVFIGPNRDGARDVYDGGGVGGTDVDTLVLELDRAGFDDPRFQGELAAFQATFDATRGGYAETFDFASLGLSVEGFEKFEVKVGGELFTT